MSNLHPLIKLISTGRGHYLYDGKTNRIIRISEVMRRILSLYGGKPKDGQIPELQEACAEEDVTEGLALLERLDDEFRIFSGHGLKHRTLGPIGIEEAQAILERGSSQLVLEATEACNFRCRYCVYSGGYGNMKRTHGHRHMSWEVARAAIDFYHARSRTRKRTCVGWYGGEPFLRFDLMIKCVDYARKLEWDHPEDLLLSVTTNGSLLTNEVIDFLVANDIEVLVSLDGPQSEHDRNRVTADGQGTFSRVFGRAQRFFREKARENEYNPRFTVVYTPETDLLAVNDFFVAQQIMPGRVAPISEGHAGFGPWPGSRAAESGQKLYERYCRTLAGLENRDLTCMRGMFDEDFIRIHKREISEVLEDLGGTGACFPGSHRIYVTVDGVFHMCERTSYAIPIGDVWRGFDWPRIVELVNTFRQIMDSQDCRNCWAVRFCPICYVQLATSDCQLAPPSPSDCDAQRRHFEERLTTYCRILEANPHAFDYMKDIYLSGYDERS